MNTRITMPFISVCLVFLSFKAEAATFTCNFFDKAAGNPPPTKVVCANEPRVHESVFNRPDSNRLCLEAVLPEAFLENQLDLSLSTEPEQTLVRWTEEKVSNSTEKTTTINERKGNLVQYSKSVDFDFSSYRAQGAPTEVNAHTWVFTDRIKQVHVIYFSELTENATWIRPSDGVSTRSRWTQVEIKFGTCRKR